MANGGPIVKTMREGEIAQLTNPVGADKEYFEALARMRKHKSNITAGTIKKIKAMDLPEISGNLSRKKFFFF